MTGCQQTVLLTLPSAPAVPRPVYQDGQKQVVAALPVAFTGKKQRFFLPEG